MLSGRTHHCEFSWFLPNGASSVVLSKESPHTASKRGTWSSRTVKTMTKGHFRQNQASWLRRKSWCRRSVWILWSEGERRFDICCVTLQDIPLVGTTSSRLCCDPNWESGPSPAVCGNKTRRFLRRTADIWSCFVATKTRSFLQEVGTSPVMFVVTKPSVFKETLGQFKSCCYNRAHEKRELRRRKFKLLIVTWLTQTSES